MTVNYEFQSRNRDTFLFKEGRISQPWVSPMFQSRNRDTFLFKKYKTFVAAPEYSFNLVIEILFFSRKRGDAFSSAFAVMFQSRNRDTFLFKGDTGGGTIAVSGFQSRNRDTFLFKSNSCPSRCPFSHLSFNLVIEILFFSSAPLKTPSVKSLNCKFQSRNRDTFLFKPT